MPAGRTLGPLRLVHSTIDEDQETIWFCGRCAQTARAGATPAPSMRVCPSCRLGLLLESRADLAPQPADAFVVVDSMLAVEAVSQRAERLLGVTELDAVRQPVRELIVPAGVEGNDGGVMRAMIEAATGSNGLVACFVRPRNTYGVRLRARIGACGPPRAALIVFDADGPRLRSV